MHTTSTMALSMLALAALGVACSSGSTTEEPTEYTTQGVCAAGDTRIDDDADRDDDEADDGDGGRSHAAAPKTVHCRRGRGDAGTTRPDAGSTCTAFAFTAYGPCQPDGTQTRTIVAASPAGCTGGNPVLTRACTYTPPATDAGTPPPPTQVTCTSFTYSAWGACQANGTQVRTVVASSPAGCTGGSPALSQACTYIDGAALYTQYCAGCHGTSKKGSSATSIQNAINANIGGMGSLKSLSAAQIQAIATAP